MTTIKTITLTQPWATLLAIGEKKVETRGWRPRGLRPGERVAIHAAKSWGEGDDGLYTATTEPFKSALRRGYHAGLIVDPVIAKLPRGCVIAIATFDKVVPGDSPLIDTLSEQEQDFGYYGEGRWAWFFSNVKPIEPIRARGQLWLWDWTPPDWMTYLDPEQVLAERAAKAVEASA